MNAQWRGWSREERPSTCGAIQTSAPGGTKAKKGTNTSAISPSDSSSLRPALVPPQASRSRRGAPSPRAAQQANRSSARCSPATRWSGRTPFEPRSAAAPFPARSANARPTAGSAVAEPAHGVIPATLGFPAPVGMGVRPMRSKQVRWALRLSPGSCTSGREAVSKPAGISAEDCRERPSQAGVDASLPQARRFLRFRRTQVPLGVRVGTGRRVRLWSAPAPPHGPGRGTRPPIIFPATCGSGAQWGGLQRRPVLDLRGPGVCQSTQEFGYTLWRSAVLSPPARFGDSTPLRHRFSCLLRLCSPVVKERMNPNPHSVILGTTVEAGQDKPSPGERNSRDAGEHGKRVAHPRGEPPPPASQISRAECRSWAASPRRPPAPAGPAPASAPGQARRAVA
ncbi:hypothetical protein SAMN00790413_01730 [Deinococcus hopiensis KR-140]|uniref:Uncharacterized protein n=1 Tax=Deinococcus hopiensis KR-140 TaxID=695939 RepID=A0A1W1VHQ1_9DEIO|nr:hypothetical protein SAMN00790413_01730 [Deinococcus hopiensis KR-140]